MKNKVIGTMPCGCKVVRAPDKTMNPWVEYCPLHKAAPDMYEALQLWTQHNQGTRGHYCSECATAIEKALALAGRRTP